MEILHGGLIPPIIAMPKRMHEKQSEVCGAWVINISALKRGVGHKERKVEFEMDEPKEVTVTISEGSFKLDLPIDDEKLMACVFFGLKQYVKNGFPIKVKQAYLTFSGTEEVVTKVISSVQQVAEWRNEIKQAISAIRKR